MKLWLPDIALVNDFRLKVGSYYLQKEVRIRKRDTVGIGLESARSIGLIFNADDEKAFKQIREFSEYLKAGGKRNVKALGYVPKAEVASFLQASQDFDFFSKEDFNWYFRPQGRKVAGFVSERFDILIDLRVKKFIPFLFISGLSRAGFKVGRFGVGNEDYYDLMINVGDNAELDFYISQIKHYLQMIDQKHSSSH